MKKILLSALIVLVLSIPELSYAKKFIIQKDIIHSAKERKVHPLEKEFTRPRNISNINSRDYNKILVLLIDFQEDSLSTTTGNGKFLQDPTGYSFPIGRPPHDQTYFSMQLEALTYYYDAVSFGNYQAEIDIFPQAVAGEDFTGYTLPHDMSYYNPIGAGSELMIERFEQYFLDCFNTADEDENINLSEYLDKINYYTKNVDIYLNKWGKNEPDIKKQFGLYYRYFGVFIEQGKWKKLLRHPILAFGMYWLRFLVGVKYIMRSKG